MKKIPVDNDLFMLINHMISIIVLGGFIFLCFKKLNW